MAKEVSGLIKLQIRGGAANPAPPVGPALGAKGVNIMEFCKQFNARTQDQAGKVIPVIISVYKDKSFDFIIKTPPGYSSLFLPPMNNTDDRFSIIPGIVDTDTYKLEVNFPIVFNGDKYESLKTTIKRGTPYVQVIPFKRDSWTMSIEEIKEKKNNLFNFYKYLLNNYKKISWS